MKIAIVGSGIAGLASGYLLSKKHEIHLFEADQRLGGHTHTVDVTVPSGSYAVDTGFIVFNDKNYPLFTKLMSEIGLGRKKTQMSFSVKVEHNGFEYNGTSLNSLFCQRKNIFNPKFYHMISDILRFNKQATAYYLEHIKSDTPDMITLEDYVRQNGYSEEFIEYYIIPMGAALWSASRQEMRQFPLHFFVRFFHHHGMLSVDARPQWYVMQDGSRSYIPYLSKPFKDSIHLASPVSQLNRTVDGKIELTVKGEKLLFDHVVLACHADQAMKIHSQANELERDVMKNFSYRPNNVLLHTDTNILPKSKLGWASWNYFIPRSGNSSVAVTYDMNILQSLPASETFLVSLNMEPWIDPNKILKRIDYSHPVFDLAASNAQRRWHEISGQDRVHYCGAYWGNGFHEDGVRSAVQVAKHLGVEF